MSERAVPCLITDRTGAEKYALCYIGPLMYDLSNVAWQRTRIRVDTPSGDQ